jgi:hypothetical protein
VRFAPLVTYNFYFRPANIANTCTHRLAYGLFDGKTTRQTGGTTFTITLFLFCKKAIIKALSMPGNPSFHSRYFNHVYADC